MASSCQPFILIGKQKQKQKTQYIRLYEYNLAMNSIEISKCLVLDFVFEMIQTSVEANEHAHTNWQTIQNKYKIKWIN